MTRHFKEKEGGRDITTLIPDNAIDIYCDGVGPVMIGFPYSKVTLVRQRLSDPASQDIEREIVATFQIPTASLIELGKHAKRTLQESGEEIEEALKQAQKLIHEP